MNDFIYLNNAATSWPKPGCVAEAVSKALASRPGHAGRGGVEDFDVFSEARNKIAGVIGVRTPGQIALGPNSTWALNLGIFGYRFRKGDAALTTKAEHNSVLRPLYALEQRGLINVIYLDTDRTGRIPLEEWESALARYSPRLALFTHASNVTGAVNDAESLIKAAKAAGADVLMDASQTCGWEDIEADNWGADMVAFTGHKYLLGPQGTGGLYVRPGLVLDPHLVGGTGIHSDLETMPEDMPAHLEAGTGNEPSFCGLLAALEWAERNPPDKAETGEMLAALRRGLSDAGADVVEPEGACMPVVSFGIAGKTPSEVGFILNESYGIICRAGMQCAPKLFGCLGRPGGTVRLSVSRFTTMDEIETAIGAVRDIADEV